MPLVAKYQAALDEYYPDEDPGFVSLEGYLAGRLAIDALEALRRRKSLGQCFLERGRRTPGHSTWTGSS